MGRKYNKYSDKMIGDFYSPYMDKKGDILSEWYTTYEQDDSKYIIIDGKEYSKIIQRCEWYVNEKCTHLVSIEPKESLKIGDILIDENSREFVIKTFEMVRLSGKQLPKWIHKILTMAICGSDYNIGEYLAKK